MRGLDPTAVCPECGEPVWRSIAEAVDLVPVPIDEPTARRISWPFTAIAASVLTSTIATAVPPAAWLPNAWWEEIAGLLGEPWLPVLVVIARSGSALGFAAVVLSAALLWWGGRGSPLASAMLALPRRLLLLGGVPWGLAMVALQAGLFPPIAITALAGTSLGVVLLAASLAAERLGPISRRWRTGGVAIQRPWALIAAIAIGLASLGVRGAVETVGGRAGNALASGFAEGLWLVAAFVSAISILLVGVGSIYLAVNLGWIARDLRRRRPAIGEVIDAAKSP